MSSRLSGLDRSVGSGLLRFLRMPALFIATNWALLICALTVLGLVPGLIAGAHVIRNRAEYSDRAFTATLRAALVRFRRDWPVSLAVLAMTTVMTVNIVLVVSMPAMGARVFFAGLIVPVVWVLIAGGSAYVAAAQLLDERAGPGGTLATRRAVLRQAAALMVLRPARMLVIPVVVIAVSPLWILPPITVAVGLSLATYLVTRAWGPPAVLIDK